MLGSSYRLLLESVDTYVLTYVASKEERPDDTKSVAAQVEI